MKNKPCKHKLQLGHCRKCRPQKFCRHRKHRSHCRICNIRGWAGAILAVARADAKRHGHVPPHITPENLVLIARESKFCVGCSGKLDWSKKPHMHHDHKSGYVHGFCHPHCNQAEGMLSKLTLKQQVQFVMSFFPETGQSIKELICRVEEQ